MVCTHQRKRKLVQEADTAEEVPSCQGQTKRCKIATHSAPAAVPHLLDMPCHPDDIVGPIGNETGTLNLQVQ